MKKTLLSAAAIIIAGVSANAQTLGTPPTVSGNPNAYGNIDSSQSTYTQTSTGPAGLDTLTLALDVTPHFTPTVPAVNTLGVGSYGVSTGTGTDSRSFWNYDFAASSSLNLLSTYTLTLTVLNVGNGQSASYNPAAIGDNHVVNGGTTIGNSESLDFTLSGAPFATDPAFFGSIGYDPNANDTYDVTLTAASLTGAPIASDSIQIIAGTGAAAPDATSTMGLMSAGIAALGLVSRRFRK